MFKDEETCNAEMISGIKSLAASVSPPPGLKRKVMELVEMRNEKGDLLASVRIDSFQEDDAMDAVIRELQPGTGKAIYIADGGEDAVSQQTNYKAVPWEHGLDALLALASPYKPLFPVDAELLEARVYYGFDNLTKEETDSMIAESRDTGKRVVVRDLRPNRTLVGASLLYRKDGIKFEFRILGTTKSRIHVPDIGQHTVEHLTVRGHEAVYVADQGRQQLIWAEEDFASCKPLKYTLSAERSDRSWLMNIAENLA